MAAKKIIYGHDASEAIKNGIKKLSKARISSSDINR